MKKSAKKRKVKSQGDEARVIEALEPVFPEVANDSSSNEEIMDELWVDQPKSPEHHTGALIVEANSRREAESSANDVLALIDGWITQNHLKLNPEKCATLLIRERMDPDPERMPACSSAEWTKLGPF